MSRALTFALGAALGGAGYVIGMSQERSRQRGKRHRVHSGPVTTRTGRVLTENDFDELASEAERGYKIVPIDDDEDEET